MLGSLRCRRGRTVAAALVLVAGFAACGDSYQFETSTGLGGRPDTALSGGGGSIPPFLMLVEDAKDSTAFRGVRRVRSIRGVDILDTRQDVGSDGTGAFAIELLEVLSLTPEFELASFPIVFENSVRFQWQVRDFRLRDLDRTARNYSINILPQTPTVAGIVCARVEFYRNNPIGGRPGHYEADIDPQTGFVLAWREFDLNGQLLVESVYESFEYGGDVSDLSLRGRMFSAQPLDLAGNLSAQLGFEARYPDVVPDGFDVISGELMDVPTSIGVTGNTILEAGAWARFLMTDGIETVTFIHDDDQSPSALVIGEVMLLRHGAWEIGFGEIHGTGFAIAGRVGLDMIRQIVQSAF